MKARVIVASNRAWAGVYADSSGPIIVAGLRQLGFEVADPMVVPDGEPVGEALLEAVAAQMDLVVTSGSEGRLSRYCRASPALDWIFLISRSRPSITSSMRLTDTLWTTRAAPSEGESKRPVST